MRTSLGQNTHCPGHGNGLVRTVTGVTPLCVRTGRICTRLSDLFLVQWDEPQELYPDSVVVGPVW